MLERRERGRRRWRCLAPVLPLRRTVEKPPSGSEKMNLSYCRPILSCRRRSSRVGLSVSRTRRSCSTRAEHITDLVIPALLPRGSNEDAMGNWLCGRPRDQTHVRLCVFDFSLVPVLCKISVSSPPCFLCRVRRCHILRNSRRLRRFRCSVSTSSFSSSRCRQPRACGVRSYINDRRGCTLSSARTCIACPLLRLGG
jgi:hypothetical protein